MVDASQKLLHVFLQKAKDGLPVIESFLTVRDSRSCDLSAMDAAFRSTRELEEVAGLIEADSVRGIVARIRDVLGKHLSRKSCPTQAEYDALGFALGKLPVLIDCFKSSDTEPSGLTKGINRAIDMAEAFPGQRVLAPGAVKGALVDDPFAEDSIYDFNLAEVKVDLEPSSAHLADTDSAIEQVVSEIPVDPFADDSRFGLTFSEGVDILPGLQSESLCFDPFAEDPDF